MKKLLFLVLVLCVWTVKGQTPFYTINITTVENNDSLIADLLGVIAGPLPTPNSPIPDMTSHLQDIGVTGIRNNGNFNDRLDMESMFRCDFSGDVPAWYCSPDNMDNYYFEASDTLFRAIINGNFFPYFRLGGEAECAYDTLHHAFHGPQDTVAENNLIRAMVKVVEHYDTLDGGNNNLPLLNLWTEWPNTVFWQRPNNEFIWFYTKAIDTLKRHFPDKLIGGPGFLVPTVQIINGQTEANLAVDLLTSLYSHNLTLDFVTWHLWSCNPENFYLAGEQMRNFLDGTGDFTDVPWAGTGFFANTQIYCDAYGVPATVDIDGTPYSDYELYLIHNKEKGSAILTADWIAMQQTNTQMAYYYRFADIQSLPDSVSGDNEGWSGLFYGDSAGTYKPQAYAFKLWSKLFNEFPNKLSNDFPLTTSDSEMKLWVLSARNDTSYAVLISNTDSIAKEFEIKIAGMSLTNSSFDIFSVNDENNGLVPVHSTNNNFIIPPYTVQLIVINGAVANSKNLYSDIEIYPNPVKNGFFIKNSETLNLSVYNIFGRCMLKNTTVNNNNFFVNIQDFPAGIYIISLTNGQNVKNFKLIKTN